MIFFYIQDLERFWDIIIHCGEKEKVEKVLQFCQRHKRQPPLLLHGLLRPHLPGGEDPLIHAAEEHILTVTQK